jgi:hypothetical protein
VQAATASTPKNTNGRRRNTRSVESFEARFMGWKKWGYRKNTEPMVVTPPLTMTLKVAGVEVVY